MSDVQAQVAARVPGAAGLGLLAPPTVAPVPGDVLADPAWVARQVARTARTSGTADPRVLATLWWYSTASVLLTVPVAGLLAGRPLSARLADLAVSVLPGGRVVAAVSSAAAADVADEVRTTLAAVVPAVAAAGRMRPRPLWAIATDALADRLLVLGRALGAGAAATAVAGPLAAAIGDPLPAPRYVDVGGRRFVHRVSCCLLDDVPGAARCTACPRRRPDERRALLERW